MKTKWLSFEVSSELHDFLKWYAEVVCKKKQKELVTEILTDFRDQALEHLNTIAKEELNKMGIKIED